MKSEIASNVRAILHEKCLKQGAIAVKAGYKHQAFSNMLNGRKMIADTDVIKIANALGVTPNDLFGIGKEARPGA